MQGIFISYRRQDSQSAAGRLADDIKENLAGVSVFRDVETIQPGMDFVDAINHALQSCGVLLAVIGPRWISAQDSAGRRRLDNLDDFTRLEIATALKRSDVCVIPVLVEGAQMPEPGDLPEDLRALARRNALELTDNRWNYDVSRLAATVRQALGVPPETPQTPGHPWGWFAAAAVALVMAGYLGWHSRAPAPPAVSAAMPNTPIPEPTPIATTLVQTPARPAENHPVTVNPDHTNTPPNPAPPVNEPAPTKTPIEPCPTSLSINRNLPTPFTCRCEAASIQTGSVWGSDLYTDDSNLCRAAVHVGVIPADGGTVTVVREPGGPLYVGTLRNGVDSRDYGAYSNSIRFVGAPAPGPQPCPAQLSINRNLSTPFMCRCDTTAVQSGSVWGSGVYTDDSKLCRAAAHFGVIPAGGGIVNVVREPGRPLYVGSRRNGIESRDYGAYAHSIRFVRRPSVRLPTLERVTPQLQQKQLLPRQSDSIRYQAR